jgi:LPS-assembly lipoprotein
MRACRVVVAPLNSTAAERRNRPRGRRGAGAGAGASAAAIVVVGALALSVAVSGCQVHPLYADIGGPMIAGPREELAAIEVGSPKTRVEQVFRNELLFRLTGGGGGGDGLPAPRYSLRYLFSQSCSPLAIERVEDLPGAVLVTLNATFILTDSSDGRTLLTGSTFAAASYDFSSQRFANVRAQRDAEDRAATTIAENINARLAAYFAVRG